MSDIETRAALATFAVLVASAFVTAFGVAYAIARQVMRRG